MAKRKTKKTTGSEAVEQFESKVSLLLERNAKSLQKTCDDIGKKIAEQTEELENLRRDFIITEREQEQKLENFKLEMEELEANTQESAKELIEQAEQEAKEIVETAKQQRDLLVKERQEAIKKLQDDYEYNKKQFERMYNETVLTNKEAAYQELIKEFGKANISQEELEYLQKRLTTAEEHLNTEIEKAVANVQKSLEKDHEIEIIKIQSLHSSEVAKYEPQIQALKQEIKRLEGQVENYKEMMDANREAQVKMSSNMKADIYNQYGDKK